MDAVSLQGGAKIRDSFEALKDVLDDFNAVFTDTGMHINSLDVNGVALVNATFWGSRFQRYSCARTFVCGLNMAVLYKTFKLVGKSTELTMRIDERYPSALYVCMENSSSGLKIEVTLKIWGSDKKMLKIENSIFDRYITIKSADFQSLIGYIAAFQNSADDDNKILDIEVHQNALVLASKGQFGVTRVCVRETNTGMSVTEGVVDALDDDVVAVDANAVAAEEEDLDEALGASSAAGTKRRRIEPDGGGGANETSNAKRVLKRPTNVAAAIPPTGSRPPTDGEMALAALAPGIASAETSAVATHAASAGSNNAPSAAEAIVRNPYNLKYLRYFTKATTLSPVVRIFLRPNFPVIVMYNIGTLGVLRYCLGPAATETDDDSDFDDDDDDDGYDPLGVADANAAAIRDGEQENINAAGKEGGENAAEPAETFTDAGRMPTAAVV